MFYDALAADFWHSNATNQWPLQVPLKTANFNDFLQQAQVLYKSYSINDRYAMT